MFTRVDSSTFTVGNPMPESTLTLCQSHPYLYARSDLNPMPESTLSATASRDFGMASVLLQLYSRTFFSLSVWPGVSVPEPVPAGHGDHQKPGQGSGAATPSSDQRLRLHFLYIFKYLVANATLFYFLFYRLVLGRVHFVYSNCAWGLWGGVDVR